MTEVATIDPGPRPELTWLPVDRLDVDPAYQRVLDTREGKRHVAKITKHFRWAKFQAIQAVPAAEPNRWLVIDGQHRFTAAKAIGIPVVPAVVLHGLTREEAASAFLGANRDRLAVSAQSIFHAELAAGEPDAVAIDRLVRAAGIEVVHYRVSNAQIPAGKTNAISSLRAILRSHGETIAANAISAVAATFADKPGLMRGWCFEAAARYLAAGKSQEELLAAFKAIGWQRLEDVRAATGGGQATRVATVVGKLHAHGGMIGVAPISAPASPGAPHKVGPLPPTPQPERALEPSVSRGGGSAPSYRFEDDPRAKRDRGSPGGLGAPEPFGRSSVGSSLA